MLLQDVIENHLVKKYRKDKAVWKNKERVVFSQIKLPEMYQKINDQADAKASANAIAYSFMDKEKRKGFYSFHEKNIIISKDPEIKDRYNLICGLISYKTLEKVFEDRKRKYDYTASKAGESIDPWRDPTIRVTVTEFDTRADFMADLKDRYELSFRTDPGYLRIDDKQEYDQEKVKDEMIRLSEDSKYDLPIEAIQVDNVLYPVSNIEYAAAVIKYNESVNDKNKKDSVFINLTTNSKK